MPSIPSPPSPLKLRLWFAFSIIGILVGILAGVMFYFQYKNINAAGWALISSVVAAVTLFIHIQYVRDVWKTKSHQLTYFMYSGCFFQLAGVSGMVAYLTLAITENKPFEIYGENSYLVVVWCFMTLKWGFSLFYSARSYRKLYEDQYQLTANEAYA